MRRKEIGGKTDATSRPMTKKSQLMSMPILMSAIDHTPQNSAKTSTASLDTSSSCGHTAPNQNFTLIITFLHAFPARGKVHLETGGRYRLQASYSLMDRARPNQPKKCPPPAGATPKPFRCHNFTTQDNKTHSLCDHAKGLHAAFENVLFILQRLLFGKQQFTCLPEALGRMYVL